MARFEISGFDRFGELSTMLGKQTQRKVDNAARRGLTKGIENVIYGRSNRIGPNNIAADSAINAAARALRIDPHHVFFRTFTRGVKTGASGKGAKPFAASMMRANSINVTSLLVKNIKQAQELYGFKSRRGKTGKKTRPSNMAQIAQKARVGGRRGGKVKVGNRTYNNSYIEDGSLRASSDAMERFYVNSLGADPSRRLNGNQFLVIQRKSETQSKPYPTKAVKIDQKKVQRAFDNAVKLAAKRRGEKSRQIQQQEVDKELKKLGFKFS